MATKTKVAASFQFAPRLRITGGKEIAFGPGKADLLEGLRKTGSITQAAARMNMSYMRAWTLIRTMNQCFREPLVVAVRGGTKGGGGARLTETGQKVLELYQRMNRKCLTATRSDWRQFETFLRNRAA